MTNRNRITPACRACGTPMEAVNPDSAINFWCPKCKLGDWNKQNNNRQFDWQSNNNQDMSNIFDLSERWK